MHCAFERGGMATPSIGGQTYQIPEPKISTADSKNSFQISISWNENEWFRVKLPDNYFGNAIYRWIDALDTRTENQHG